MIPDPIIELMKLKDADVIELVPPMSVLGIRNSPASSICKHTYTQREVTLWQRFSKTPQLMHLHSPLPIRPVRKTHLYLLMRFAVLNHSILPCHLKRHQDLSWATNVVRHICVADHSSSHKVPSVPWSTAERTQYAPGEHNPTTWSPFPSLCPADG